MVSLKGREGGCLCGAIRYRLEEEPMIINACHCADCQTISGSAFVLNMWMEDKNVTLLGDDPVSYMNKSGSGNIHEIMHCEECGTDVFSKYHASIGIDKMVRVGTLDDVSGVEPDAHVHTASRQSWLKLPEDKPIFKGFYNVMEQFSEASKARFKAMMAEISKE